VRPAIASSSLATQALSALQVPYESLKRTTRDRKGVVEEFTAIVDALQAASDPAVNPQDLQGEVLSDVERRVGSLKRKVCLSSIVTTQQHSAVKQLNYLTPSICQVCTHTCIACEILIQLLCCLQLDELDAVEAAELRRCCARLAHLQACLTTNSTI
jgi:hypothetical protein